MSTEIGIRAPGLDPGPEYPQWKWYTVYDGDGNPAYDFSVQVNKGGDLVGVGDFPGRATVGSLPEPGPDWLYEAYAVLAPYEGSET